eukprot:TRINITY_DN12577_c0_g1_i1.p1 TRINITY_DN12577_c0_g1~~TRINITY_DN12577_c0_g1_i1.p1  ORF type:complete len:185 (+),score=43.12 TRINITY_DN12577_c0_g1_i1:3-557(+)
MCVDGVILFGGHTIIVILGCGVEQLLFFFFNDTATTEIYTILFVGSVRCVQETVSTQSTWELNSLQKINKKINLKKTHFSEIQIQNNQVCTPPKLDLKPEKGILKKEKPNKQKITLRDIEKQGFQFPNQRQMNKDKSKQNNQIKPLKTKNSEQYFSMEQVDFEKQFELILQDNQLEINLDKTSN